VSAPRRAGGQPPEPDAGTPPEPDAGTGADPALVEAVDALASPVLVPRQRRGLIVRLARQTASAVPSWQPGAVLRWAVDTVTDLAPYLPVRDLAALRHHHGGLDGDLLAQRLIRNAARATAGVGAAGGGLAAVKWTVPPTLLSAPVLVGVETVAVVAIEIKLVGELHQAYRRPLPGQGPVLAAALLRAWVDQRGVDPLLPGIGAVLGTAARAELRDRLAARFGRNLTTLGPLLTGAAVASFLNQRATRALGQQVQADLRP
jgi:hypothetical protein